jgi:hypothetical protein
VSERSERTSGNASARAERGLLMAVPTKEARP